MLRHRPEAIGVQLDPEGWVAIDQLLEAANQHGQPLTLKLLHDVVATNDKQRFALSEDGVHPQLAGHALMAQIVLRGIGLPIDDIDPQDLAAQLKQDELFQLVQERRAMRSMAWLVDIGFEKPGDYDALPVEEAEAKAKAQKAAIFEMVRN